MASETVKKACSPDSDDASFEDFDVKFNSESAIETISLPSLRKSEGCLSSQTRPLITGLVDVGSIETDRVNCFAPRSRRFGPRFQLGAFYLAGVVFMLLQHFLYWSLNENAVSGASLGSFSFGGHPLPSILGNALAYAARTVLSAGIGVAFVQVLWLYLRTKKLSISQIDALVVARGQPFAPSAASTWRHAFGLVALASAATLMALISIVTPSALQFVTQTASVINCNASIMALDFGSNNGYLALVNRTDDTTAFMGPQPWLMAVTLQVLTSGVSLPSLSTCASGECSYAISATAPTVNCTAMENPEFNFEPYLPSPANNNGSVRVWNFLTSDPSGFWIFAATQDVNMKSQSAVNCTLHNATYNFNVFYNDLGSFTTHEVDLDVHEQLNMTLDPVQGALSQKDEARLQYVAFSTAFIDTLVGTVDWSPSQLKFVAGSNNSANFPVAYSLAGEVSPEVNTPWTRPPVLSSLLPELMQNMLLSLLIGSPSTNSDNAFGTACETSDSSAIFYKYRSTPLLATYGGTLAVAAICTAFGFYAIRSNQVEESFSFSRVLGAVLNNSLYESRYELGKASRLTLNGSEDGQLRLVEGEKLYD